MTVITEIDNVEICRDCGHVCHCDTDYCINCGTDEYDEDTCTSCRHG